MFNAKYNLITSYCLSVLTMTFRFLFVLRDSTYSCIGIRRTVVFPKTSSKELSFTFRKWSVHWYVTCCYTQGSSTSEGMSNSPPSFGSGSLQILVPIQKALLILLRTYLVAANLYDFDCSAKACKMDWRIHQTTYEIIWNPFSAVKSWAVLIKTKVALHW